MSLKNEVSSKPGIVARFRKVLSSSGLSEVTIETMEAILDRDVAEGIAKDVPILKTLLGLVKTGNSIRDAIEMRKLFIFLENINEVDDPTRIAKINSIEGDPNSFQDVGAQLILILARQDDLIKPIMLASAFVAFLRERITYETFHELARAIDRISPHHVKVLQSCHQSSNSSASQADGMSQLEAAGLVERQWVLQNEGKFGSFNPIQGHNGRPIGLRSYFRITNLGVHFCHHCIPKAKP